MDNIFRQAYNIIQSKTTDRMTEDEQELVGKAITLTAYETPKLLPQYDDLPISEGLLKLAEMVETKKED